jgi:uncharacterized protein YebE (UPF0316 family)
MGVPDYLPIDPAWLPLVIFCARIGDVSIGTLRMICIVRDRRPLAVFLSFAEVSIWLLAVTSVLTHLDQWVNILAYAGGYATGSAMGMWIESRLALGTQVVTFLSCGTAHAVAERLRFADQNVTTLAGRNQDGPVAICYAILPRRHTAAAIRMAREVDPDVIATVEDVRATTLDRLVGCGPGKVPLPWRGPMLRRLLRNHNHGYATRAGCQRSVVGNDGDSSKVPQAA